MTQNFQTAFVVELENSALSLPMLRQLVLRVKTVNQFDKVKDVGSWKTGKRCPLQDDVVTLLYWKLPLLKYFKHSVYSTVLSNGADSECQRRLTLDLTCRKNNFETHVLLIFFTFLYPRLLHVQNKTIVVSILTDFFPRLHQL